ncbi:hypothetical protein [Tropicimonas sediminicola]|uniref:Uncharacterized protein n=1 Tax=Tropicimonas sediminicola TaxID=1031541 RepID=A0A239ELP1_9RHOB|nr:hypothetical protein [Tropicimonas sediminicola]SNS45556.1 hypothetical protein SAMN05421757_102221 [Tropicimonas sediminicola]
MMTCTVTYPYRLCRALVLRILTGLIVELPAEDLRARISALPLHAQIPLIGNFIVTLGLATLVFAHAGWGGPIAFWLALALVVR